MSILKRLSESFLITLFLEKLPNMECFSCLYIQRFLFIFHIEFLLVHFQHSNITDNITDQSLLKYRMNETPSDLVSR